MVNYHVHKTPPLVDILRQKNLVHNLTACFFEVHFNYVYPTVSLFPSGLSVAV